MMRVRGRGRGRGRHRVRVRVSVRGKVRVVGHIPVGEVDEGVVLRFVKAQREVAHLGVHLR